MTRIAKLYEQRFKEPPYRLAGNCYDAVRVMSRVMNEVGAEGRTVNAALHRLRDYRGVTGNFEIAPNNDRLGEEIELRRVRSKAN